MGALTRGTKVLARRCPVARITCFLSFLVLSSAGTIRAGNSYNERAFKSFRGHEDGLAYYGTEKIEHVYGGNITKESTFAAELESMLANQTGHGGHGRNLAGCVYTNGRWVFDVHRPAYSPRTCPWIRSSFNCAKNGRRDLNFERYSWQPFGCNMGKFDIHYFLSLMRNKILGVVGDSFSRNFAQSLLCQISAHYPVKLWSAHLGGVLVSGVIVPAFNTKIVTVVSPFVTAYSDQPAAFRRFSLTRTAGEDYVVWLDVMDPAWARPLKYIDLSVFMSGHWFITNQGDTDVRSVSFVRTGRLVRGTSGLQAYAGAMRNVLGYVQHTLKYRGVPMWLTYSPSHYTAAGTCPAQSPVASIAKYVKVDGSTAFVATEKSVLGGTQFRIVDVTKISDFRPDAHVSRYYGAASNSKTSYDCTHWCLPGVPDTWTDVFQYVLRTQLHRAT